jgi:hypothetical protein
MGQTGSKAYATLELELAECRHELASAEARLVHNPNDAEAQKRFVEGREFLEKLEIAEAVLIGLFGEDERYLCRVPPLKEKY